MKLLYIIKRPLSRRDAERFGIFRALERGFSVRVFDISVPTHPELAADMDLSWVPPTLEIEVFQSWKSLRRRQQAFAEADLVLLLSQSHGLSRGTLPTLRLLARTKTPYLILGPIWYGMVEPRLADIPIRRKFKEAIQRAMLMDPLNSLISRIPPHLLGIPQARWAIYTGLASMSANSLVGPQTEPIYTHTSDYDLFLRLSSQRKETLPQAVFLDQFAPFHVDTQVIKTRTVIEPDHYYACLRGLFDRIEAELGLKVVIAAHPRADYQDRPELLGNRPIHYGKTIDLIAESQVVISHVSTALGMAVLFRRPVMLIATQAYYDLTPGHPFAFDQAAQSLATPLLMIDDVANVPLQAGLEVNEGAYDLYLERFMRHPKAPDGYQWDIVFDIILGGHAIDGSPKRD